MTELEFSNVSLLNFSLEMCLVAWLSLEKRTMLPLSFEILAHFSSPLLHVSIEDLFAELQVC